MEAVEQGSSHPISIGLRSFCQDQHTSPLIADDVASNQDLPAEICIISSSEKPGRGLQAEVLINEERINIIVGNALFMSEMEAIYGTGGEEERVAASKLLLDWSGQGQSVVLVAISLSPLASSSPAFNHYTIVALFGIEDPVRPEASYVITELERQGIAVFVCSGDNPTTTLAVARRLGMKSEQVFAGVLPGGKKEVVESLQNGAAAGRTKELRMRRSWWTRLTKRRGGKNGEGKAKVLFVGDGVRESLFVPSSRWTDEECRSNRSMISSRSPKRTLAFQWEQAHPSLCLLPTSASCPPISYPSLLYFHSLALLSTKLFPTSSTLVFSTPH